MNHYDAGLAVDCTHRAGRHREDMDDQNLPNPTDTANSIEQLRNRTEHLTTSSSGALVSLNGSSPADAQKRELAESRATAMRMREEAKSLEKQVHAEMEARLAELRAITAPLVQKIKQMEEGIWTINLYLGRDEEIVTLTTGTPAGADEPLVLRQEVLSMDEETAAYAEQGGIDARHIEVFDKWITQPENLNRVLPETKGVVVLVPRKRGRDYADPWLDKNLNEENRWSYFLIRNGDNLYRMRTDFIVGKHLIPTTDEFTGLFVARRYNHTTRQDEVTELVPGTREWDKAAERQDARQRHYMRVALILQGLVDRTTVFAPLPPAGVNLLSARTYAEGTARLVRDAEHVLTDGRADFYTWLSRLNADLRPGMRIIGSFTGDEFKHAGNEYTESGYYHPNNRVSPRARDSYYADKPKSQVLYTLEGRRSVGSEPGFYFKFGRTHERFIGSGYNAELRTPKTRGTCVVLPQDKFIIPFDLVTVEEMRYYLGSRRQRHAYEHMFPLLHAAIAAKEDEAAQEAPFRELLAGELVKAYDLDLGDAQAAVPALVDWWKLANKWHRPLVATDDPGTETKAINAIVTEYAARQKAATTGAADAQHEAGVVAALLAQDPTIMIIGRKRDGGFLAFAPQARTYGDGVAHQSLWVTEYTTTRTAKKVSTRTWVTPGLRMDRTRVLFSKDQWATWDKMRGPFDDLTDTEIDTFADHLATVVPAEYATGWADYTWGATTPFRTEDPRDVLVLGVTADQTNQTIEVWLTPAAAPTQLGEVPSAEADNGAHLSHGRVRVPWTKTQRNGAALAPRHNWEDRWDIRHYGASDAQPWGRINDGRSRNPFPVRSYAPAQAQVTDMAARIKDHNNKVTALRGRATAALWVVKAAWEARAEAEAYAQFLEDYVDPALWEGHRKTLRLEADLHPHGRGVPDVLRTALHVLADRGTSLEGHTVGSVLTAAGLEPDGVAEDLLNLPVWVDQDNA